MRKLLTFIFVCAITMFSSFANADQVDFRHKVFTFNSVWNFDQFIPPDGGKLDYRYRFELYNKRLGLEWTIFSLGGNYNKLNGGHFGSTTLDMKLGPTLALCNYIELYAGAGPQGYVFGGYVPGDKESRNGYAFGSWGVVVDAGARITLKWFFVSASYTPNIPLGGEPGIINVDQFEEKNSSKSVDKYIVDGFNPDGVEKVKGTWHNNYSLSLGFIW